MEYMIKAYRGRINSLIALEANEMPVGAVTIPGSDELFVVCLAMQQEPGLAEVVEEPDETKKE